MTKEEKEYLEKYQKEYGVLDEEGKKHILKYRNFLTEEELEKDINEWIGMTTGNFWRVVNHKRKNK